MPIYVINKKSAQEPIEKRLVRATNIAQALRFVASEFAVEHASQDAIATLCSAGVKVEQAVEPPNN